MKFLIILTLSLTSFISLASGEHLGGVMGGGEKQAVKVVADKVLTDKQTNKTHNCKEIDSNEKFVILQCTK